MYKGGILNRFKMDQVGSPLSFVRHLCRVIHVDDAAVELGLGARARKFGRICDNCAIRGHLYNISASGKDEVGHLAFLASSYRCSRFPAQRFPRASSRHAGYGAHIHVHRRRRIFARCHLVHHQCVYEHQ